MSRANATGSFDMDQRAVVEETVSEHSFERSCKRAKSSESDEGHKRRKYRNREQKLAGKRSSRDEVHRRP